MENMKLIWEREEELCIDFPHLFPFLTNLEDEILFKGVGFVILKMVYKKYIEELLILCAIFAS